MNIKEYSLFTSESVSNGHPDKIADQISDAVLDAVIAKDPNCRVACETLVKTGLVIVAGEMTTKTWVNIEEIARKIIKEIGYDDPELGFDSSSCAVLTSIGTQSPDIAQGVDRKDKKLGAGDQGLMFGYATNETDVLMPAPIIFAHRMMQKQFELRKNRKLPWLRPDAKSQVTVHYDNTGKPFAVDSVVLSTQHHPDIENGILEEAVMEEIIKPVIPMNWITPETKFYINPTGRFVIGGPKGDCGLTGRKIIVDSYGGMARHGGGCFSGKDPSKVDRSGAYAGRYVAKNIVAAGLADRCEVQIAYAIGIAEPIAVDIDTFGTGKISDEKISQLIREYFDLRPGGIIQMLDLLHPIYLPTAAFGHFGRTEKTFTWEKTDKAEVLRNAAGIKEKIRSL